MNRFIELRKLGILDTEEEAIFNEIVKTASIVCESPISLISLLDRDRQWFKAHIGTEVKETPIAIAVCNHTIGTKDGSMFVKNLSDDARFKSNPFVTDDPKLKSYYGVSLTTNNNVRIGTVCVFDDKVREFDSKQISCLNTLAMYTMNLIHEKVLRRESQIKSQSLISLNKNLEKYNYMVAHDVKGPLRIINSFIELVNKDSENNLSEKSKEYLSYVSKSAKELDKMTTNLLEYSKKSNIELGDIEELDLNAEVESIINLVDPQRQSLNYILEDSLPTIITSRSVIHQAFLNIISNAIKYRDEAKEEQNLTITFEDTDNFLILIFEDNGKGMSNERLQQVFELFNRDKRDEMSFGVGLTVTRDILMKLKSEISLDSTLGSSTSVKVKLKKH